MATKRSSFDCRALYTAPMPPWPMSSMISYRGNCAASSSTDGGTNEWCGLVGPDDGWEWSGIENLRVCEEGTGGSAQKLQQNALRSKREPR